MNPGKVIKFLFWLQAGVNLIGALGPELSFDALWYHLPLARLLAERGIWGNLPGGLLYFSGMPRLMDWIYGELLWLGKGMESPETLTKLLHWMMGVASAGLIVKMGGWAPALLWYSTPLVGWLSMTAYVDLARTFWVLLAARLLTSKKPYKSALVIGVAYSTKMLAGVEAVILATIWGLSRKSLVATVKYLLVVTPFVLFWGLLNVSQGYEFFYPMGQFGVVAEHVGWDWRVITGPMIGEGRYILPELALLSIWLGKQVSVKKWIIVGAVVQGVVGIGYRGVANTKFVPYLLGKESKDEFLTKNLNFEYGDWYDADGWVRTNLTDKQYLVVGVHNTYYLPGHKWEHESWAGDGCFGYMLMQGEGGVSSEWEEIHRVEQTLTKVYIYSGSEFHCD